MIECKSARQVGLMRQAGKIVAGALRLARELAVCDVTTDYIDTNILLFRHIILALDLTN